MTKPPAGARQRPGGGSDATEARAGSLTPLQRVQTLKERAATLIRAAIVEGSLPAGSYVTVSGVAELLGVSATPVREALMHLAEAGLVSMEGGRIAIVSPTESALREAFEVREAVEGMAARLAARNRTEPELAELWQSARASLSAATAQDASGFRAHDLRFHRTVASAAHNAQLLSSVTNALDLALTLRNLRTLGERFSAGAAHMHLGVVEAIEAHDEDAAEREMRSHIRSVLQALVSPEEADRGGEPEVGP